MVSPSDQIQSPWTTEQFTAEYEDLMSNWSPAESTMLVHDAPAISAGSVLAASIVDVVVLGGKVPNLKELLPRDQQSLLQNAILAAETVMHLDEFYRLHPDDGELVLFTNNSISPSNKPGCYSNMNLTYTDGSRIDYYEIPADPVSKRPAAYFIRPQIKYGASSKMIINGRAEGKQHGSENYYQHRDDSEYERFFNRVLHYRYRDLVFDTAWGPKDSVPKMVIGRSKIIDEFGKWIEYDKFRALSEHRETRPAYLLFRQAHFLGDVAVSTMHKIADEANVLLNWRSQMLQDIAGLIVHGLAYKDKPDGSPAYAHGAVSMFGRLSSDRDETIDLLDLKRDQIFNRTQQLAKHQKVQASRKEIAAALSEFLSPI